MSYLPALPRLSTAILACVILFALGASTLHASVLTSGCANINQSCTLEELGNGGSIIIHDKLFNDWFFDDFSTNPLDTGAIDVTALDDDPLNPGLQYDSNGEFSTTGLDVVDLLIGFTVSTLSGEERIKDNSLEINSFSFGAGNVGGVIDVFESVFDSNIDFLGDKFVTADNLPPPVFDLLDEIEFAPQSLIFVDTLVFIAGDDAGDLVSLDRFTQRFSQVPAPATLALFGLGLAGLGWSRRKNS